MASIEKRGQSYRISVSLGYPDGQHQRRVTETWKPTPGMTARQIRREVQREAVLFEEKCRAERNLSGEITFSAFAARWLRDYGAQRLRATTLLSYQEIVNRLNTMIGNVPLNRLRPQELLTVYEALSKMPICNRPVPYFALLERENDTPERESAPSAPPSGRQKRTVLKRVLQERGETQAALAARAGLCPSTLYQALIGKGITVESADKLAAALALPREALFTVGDAPGLLSASAIRRHHAVLSSILSTAVRWQVIPFNPCDRVQPPRQEHKEALYLDEKQAAALLTLLARESLPHRTMITLLLFTGLRRGELCGLEWKDIDFERLLLSVRRTSLYLPNRGIFTDETKNSSSRRVISLSASVVVLLREYQAWQEQTRAAAPAPWPDTDRLFTKADGTPIHPNTLSRWFTQFIARTDLPPIHIHSLRHTNATLQIAGGVPITTVADRLGHATPGTTSRIYAHAVQSANAAAAELLDQMLLPGNAPHPTSGENAGSGAPTCERRPDGNSLKNNK